MTPLHVIDLGRRPYRPVLELQRELCRQRRAGQLDQDILLLVEHDPVITLGRGTKASSLPIPAPLLEQRGFEVVTVERGGDVTVHEPGQLVGYPILDLARLRPDLHWYLRQLEEVLIQALAGLGIQAERNPGLTGVWTGGRKIGSLGIHVKEWITFHGFALNVVNDLRGFQLVIPCGIEDVTMTSVARELGTAAPAAQVWRDTRAAVIRSVGEVFGLEVVEGWPGNRPPFSEMSLATPILDVVA